MCDFILLHRVQRVWKKHALHAFLHSQKFIIPQKCSPKKVQAKDSEIATHTNMARNSMLDNSVHNCDIVHILPAKSYCIHDFYWYCNDINFHYFILTLAATKEKKVGLCGTKEAWHNSLPFWNTFINSVWSTTGYWALRTETFWEYWCIKTFCRKIYFPFSIHTYRIYADTYTHTYIYTFIYTHKGRYT